MNSAEYQWLAQDLSDHANYKCTLAYWHHPLFAWTNNATTTLTDKMQSIWNLLLANHADVVLNGHVHNYQHFVPMNAAGESDPNGITEFIVGTGGKDLQKTPPPPATPPTTLVAWQGTTFGVLKMTLKATSWTYQWQTAIGPAFSDASSANIPCV
jgi:hypothetical protein